MVKKSICTTADESDADIVEAWNEEAPRRMCHTRGNYKTYRGAPCKTEQEKKEAQTLKHKKWRANQNTHLTF